MEGPLGHRNRRVVEAARLHKSRERRRLGRTLLEGPNLLADALANGVVPEVVLAAADDEVTAGLAERHGFELVTVDEPALARLAGTRTPRGPAAVISIPAIATSPGAHLLVSWGVSDPGNVGTLIRTAAAFGWDFGHTPGSADPWSPKALRAGAGGHFRIGIRPVETVLELLTAGFVAVASVVSGGIAPSSLPSGRYALLVGEESSGLPAEVVGSAPVKVTIPMPGGIESLNAAMAAGIIVHQLSKPEGEHGGRV
ncbi:MAG: TrmH family RNA methyltransferase [Acidimicrobiia bacterium]